MAMEEFWGKVSELAQTGVVKGKELTDAGVAKAKELAEVAKLRMDNASEQEAIKKAYLEIGKLYYAERGAAPESPYTALCEKIAASKAKIEYNLERIADIKAASAARKEDSDAYFVETEVPPEEPMQSDAAETDADQPARDDEPGV